MLFTVVLLGIYSVAHAEVSKSPTQITLPFLYHKASLVFENIDVA